MRTELYVNTQFVELTHQPGKAWTHRHFLR